jgi:phytol kinase
MWSMALILTVLFVFLVLLGSELWWRKRITHSEFSRKFVHITVGSFVAFWPFFLSWNEIRLLGLGFLIIVGISKYFHVFRAIHSVQRPTLGELYFALAVGLLTFVTHNKWIYMASLLQMSLADGFAAVMGVRFGRQSYLVFSHRKTLVGSLTFFVTSLVILVAYAQLAAVHLSPTFLIGAAALAAVIENFGVAGLDNLLVPLAIAFLLTTY